MSGNPVRGRVHVYFFSRMFLIGDVRGGCIIPKDIPRKRHRFRPRSTFTLSRANDDEQSFAVPTPPPPNLPRTVRASKENKRVCYCM